MDKYLKMRNANQFDLGVLYVISQNLGLKLNPEEFQQGMATGMFLEHMINTMDDHFDLMIITNKNGEFVKAIKN